MQELNEVEIEVVAGGTGSNGVVAGPNGEGCTDPRGDSKSLLQGSY